MMEFIVNDTFRQNIDGATRENQFYALNKLIYRELYREIIEGGITPEHKLREAKLAEALHISRSPVKMALSQLLDEGVLLKEDSGYLRVRPLNFTDCLMIYEARMALEPRAAYLAAKRITKAELLVLKQCVEHFIEVDRTNDEDLYRRTEKLFHETIIFASKNQYLIAMYHSLECPLACYRNQLSQLSYRTHLPGDLEKGASFHISTYDMLRKHYDLLAEEAMRNDIQRMFRTMSILLSP